MEKFKDMCNSLDDTSFCITIDYHNYIENPAELFVSVSKIIDALKFVDETLISSFDSSIETSFMLDTIEKGSIRVLFKQFIKNIPDSALEELNFKKIIGHYLVIGKRKLLEKMEQTDMIKEKEEIEELKAELYEDAKKTDILPFRNYNTISSANLLNSMSNIGSIASQLPIGINFYYETFDINSCKKSKNLINKNFSISEKVLILTSGYIGENTCTMTIKIKQPDYVSNAMWTFKYENTSIDAKFEDTQWLHDFQDRKIDVRPKDSLKVIMKIVSYFDESKTERKNKYYIMKVLEVIQFKQIGQLSMDDM